MTERWGILARKSKVLNEADIRREVSTDAQRDMGLRAAGEAGAQVDPAHIWIELGSAFDINRERDDFEAALGCLARGEIDTLWCYMLDRFSRKGAEDLLKVIGKRRVIFDYDRLDSMEPRDRRRIIDYAEQAREYSERLSARIRDTKSQQRDAGQWLSRAPYGYVVDKVRKLHPETTKAEGSPLSPAEAVIYMYERAAEGLTLYAIAGELNVLGVPTKTGGRWTDAAVNDRLRNPVYQGFQVTMPVPASRTRMIWRDRSRVPVAVTDTPLVTIELAKQALDALAGRSHPDRVGANHRGNPKYTMISLTFCASCKGRMSTGGRAGVQCGHYQRIGDKCPEPCSIQHDNLLRFVFERWRARVLAIEPGDPNDILLVEIGRRWAALQHPEQSEAEEAAREQLKSAEMTMERLERDRRDGLYSGPAERLYGPAMREAIEAVSAAHARLAEFNGGPVDIGWLHDPESLDEAWSAADHRTKRDLLMLAIWRVEVARGKRQPTGQSWDLWNAAAEERVTIFWHDEPSATAGGILP